MSRRRPYKRRPLPPLVTATKADEAIPHAAIAPTEPEWAPTLTMGKQVAQARREMGEARWAELNREWL